MHLINPLVAGIRGAEIGSVELLERGTSTHAVYYKDFAATQQYSAQPIALDSFGSVTLYVDKLVDVLVHDSNGVLVRQFVAGDYAAAVEVISQSFTGTDYRDGTIGASKPTNLATVLDRLKASTGTTDWNVLVAGIPTTLQAAVAGVAGLYYNVKSYGAIGSGIADDGSAIAAAVTAAAIAGGTVFFPPGVYRTTTKIVIPVNVCILGTGGTSCKLAIDSLVAGACIEFTGSDNGMRTVRGMWFGSINTFFSSQLLFISGAGARVVFEDCLVGNDSTSVGIQVWTSMSSIDSLCNFVRCSFYQGGSSTIILQTGLPCGRLTLRDCDFKSTLVGASSSTQLNVIDGVLVDGCRFDASSLTGGVLYYITYGQPNGFGGCVFTNNRFKAGPAVVGAFRNPTANPTFGCWESGNSFGDLLSGNMEGYSDASDGYAPLGQFDTAGLRSRASREQRSYGINDPGGATTVNAKDYAFVSILRTVAGVQSINANKGAMGDRLVVLIVNSTGSPVAPTFGTNFAPRAGLATIPNISRGIYPFMWVPVGGGAGNWMQCATEVIA